MTVLQINFLDVISMMDNILAKAINKILPNDLKLQLKAEFEKHNQIKMSEAILSDGTKLFIDGDLSVGVKVYKVNETNKELVSDNTYEVVNADNTVSLVTTVNGEVTEIKPKEVVVEQQEEKVQMSKIAETIEPLNLKLYAIENENKTLKGEINSMNESIKVLLSAFDKLANTPVEEEQVKLSKSYEDMTPAERYRYNKGL